jgi:hydrogenase-4 membrane subunit HyfE
VIPFVEGLAAAVLLILAAALLVARTPEAAAHIYAWAAVPQAAMAVALAGWAGIPELYLDAAAILLIKGLWAPRLLRRAVPNQGEVFGLQARRSATVLFVGAAAVTLLCLRLANLIYPLRDVPLGLALAALFVGFGSAALRSELWSQAAGILMGEAGLMASALVLTAGFPPLGEAFALAEVVVLAAILAAVSRLVHATHGATDARLLRGLRG